MKPLFKTIVVLIALLMPIGVSAKKAGKDVEALKAKIEKYAAKVDKQPDWLLSRLQMYWKSHATDVYINGEKFDHVSGHAPEPTVRLAGIRGMETNYRTPAIEDVVPYDDDDESNVTYINKVTGRKEKVHPSKTGCNISSLNRHIVSIARDAAKVYGATGDIRYAKMATGVFDTFMKGIYYRNVPIDLNHGHQQTLVGMTTFEVIHEDAINELTEMYKILRPYLVKEKKPVGIYDAGFKKWAENIIDNGVPHNNWNLFQAEFIAKIALVLQNDKDYEDGKGREYYLDYIINKSSIRQWSMKKMASECFDANTNIWYECPGYSTTVINTFVSFANMLDREAGIDLFKDIPVLKNAVFATPQYLFPNRMICGFGDTHPGYLNTAMIDNVLEYARRHKEKELISRLETLRKAVQPDATKEEISQFVTPSFYAPNVSWLVQRTGMDKQHDLMVSLNGSLGNHQHANGISMELYGKGFVLGPDAGIGRYLYSGLDYSEYYSQFPAHNTVCVDGVSSYPVMMSQHAFEVRSCYPEANKAAFEPCTFSQIYFLEPETNSDQLRTNGIVKVDGTSGYYIDIFRSRRKDGKDKTHDYFYHNLGQQMVLAKANGDSLNLKPTQELAFAGGHLYAYSYIYNKVSAQTNSDIKATYTIEGDNPITMTMWMKGDAQRTVFKALSPVNLEYERIKGMPYDIDKQPVLTFVARQKGEAWLHPFVAAYEPSSKNEPSAIKNVSYFTPQSSEKSAVGIKVELKNGRTDYIFSAATPAAMSHDGITVNGVYAVVSNGKTLIEK